MFDLLTLSLEGFCIVADFLLYPFLGFAIILGFVCCINRIFF